jgi:signal transduction histidine kinase
LSIMSHELRTPLNIVMNCAEIMRTGIVGEINKEQADILDRLMSQAKNQLTLVNGILHATRMETEQLTASLEPVDVKNFLRISDPIMPSRFRKIPLSCAGFCTPTWRWQSLIAISSATSWKISSTMPSSSPR